LKNFLLHDSPYFKILNFKFKAGRELPIHSHEIEGRGSTSILGGEGEFPGTPVRSCLLNPETF